MEARRYLGLTSRALQVVLVTGVLCLALFFKLIADKFSSQTALVDAGTLFVTCFLLSNLLYTIQRYYHSKSALNSTNIALVLLFVGITLGVNHLFNHSFHASTDAHFETYYRATFFYRFIIITSLFFLVLLLFWMDQQLVREAILKARSIEKEREAIDIEMNSIQQQFNPHFLFNSLNSINALTLSNPEEASEMIQLLSEFMRGSVRQDQATLIDFSEEIRHTKLYTDIERVRFGSRLEVNYSVAPELFTSRVPPLILQPILENAIKYGLYGQTDKVLIEISARKEEKELLLTISNPFDAISQQTSKGTGFGLRSIERKMLLIFGRSNLLNTEALNGTFITTLRIPQA